MENNCDQSAITKLFSIGLLYHRQYACYLIGLNPTLTVNSYTVLQTD